jgi:hypothetical protein
MDVYQRLGVSPLINATCHWTAFVHIDPRTGLTGARVVAEMLAGEPSVAVMGFSDPHIVRADVRVLSDEEADRVAVRLRQVLSAAAAVSGAVR